MISKRIWAIIVLGVSLFFLHSATTCQICLGCKPTFLEPCSVIFMLVFLGLFAWSIVLFKKAKANSKKKKL